MNKLKQTARVSSGFGTAHSYPDHLLSCHWLNVLCFVSSSTSRRSPPPTSPCPAWWSSCSSSRRRCLAGTSATLPSPSCQYVPYSSLPFTYTHTRAQTLFWHCETDWFCRWSVSWTSSQEGPSVTFWLLLTSSRVIKDGRNFFPDGSSA